MTRTQWLWAAHGPRLLLTSRYRYITCAIGNAPWPMGITGTGIHERQGRQHLREDKIAHVMNDETQRKYLQSVKRLMTFAQRALPPDGPSKAVLNGTMI